MPASAGADPRSGGGAGEAVALPPVEFYKLTGSGNDFVFFDARAAGADAAEWEPFRAADAIRRLCDRRNGVGADGVVFLDAPAAGAVRIAYYNSDGGRAALCGNATLCAARLAEHLGAVDAAANGFTIVTDAGPVAARAARGADPAILVGGATDVRESEDVALGPGEERIGYARVGVPHLVVLTRDADAVDVAGRGAALRRPAAGRPDGANVNFVSLTSRGAWRMRTFERGVEGETLACGTGAVAVATLLARWKGAPDPVEILTSSGRVARVCVAAPGQPGRAELAGEGRLVYTGRLPG